MIPIVPAQTFPRLDERFLRQVFRQAAIPAKSQRLTQQSAFIAKDERAKCPGIPLLRGVQQVG